MEKREILLVEDDPNFGAVLRDYLELNDFEVILAKDGVQGLQAYRNNDPEVCILDVMMPNKDGFTLAGEIREMDRDLPIIFLTAKSLKEDVLKGYQVGGDDYLTKPFDSEVLLYKIRAIMNRRKQEEDPAGEEALLIGNFSYDPQTRILHKDEKEEHLSPKEGALLKMLAERKNQLVSRSEALRKIWRDDNYFTGRSMDVYVAKLRKRLKDDPKLGIINVHSEGFRLVDNL